VENAPGNFVISINSFGFDDNKGSMFGPYWSEANFNNLMNSFARCR
jgi:hypothetical protein